MTNLRTAIACNRLLKPHKTVKRRKTEEHAFQAVVVDLLERLLPADAICTSIDHANAKSAATGAERKRRGVLPGIADILVTWAEAPTTRLVVMVWIECKALRGSLSDHQKSFRDAVLAQGGYWFAPCTLEEVLVGMRQTPIPIRKITLFPSGVTYSSLNLSD